MSSVPTEPESDVASPPLAFNASRQLPQWLAESGISIAFTTYRANKLFLVGLKPDGRLSFFERTFERCMGLCVHGRTLLMSSLYQLWRFENVGANRTGADEYDAMFVPRVGFVTGDLDIHDIVVDAGGRAVFANTLFSCLATPSATQSFAPLWRPPFISKLAAEDRCHLNGIALDDGVPRYVTVVAQSDLADGWRDHRRDGGAVLDVASGEVVASGLSMPHSPRLHQGKLWLHDSGNGHFGYIDRNAGRFESVALCRGYLRGLAFAGNFAVMGVSLPRGSRTFSGLGLEQALAARNVSPMCGVLVVDLRSGDVVHWLQIEGIVEELYDVVVLPGVVRPSAIGFKSDEIRRVISVGEPQPLAAPGTTPPVRPNPILVD